MKGTTMKKALVIVALTFASASAFASKARVAALGGSMTKTDDVQDTFTNPAKMHGFGDMFTVEFGGNEEGGIFRSNGDAKWGVYFGHRSTNFANLLTNAGTTGGALLAEQNPVEVFYGQKGGDMRWGASFVYSNAEDKATNAKTNTMGLRLGAATDVWEAFANIGLAGKATIGSPETNRAANDMGVLIGGQYAAGDVLYYGSYDMSGGKATLADIKATANVVTVGAETKMKGDASHFFYGLKYVMSETKAETTPASKIASSKLPLYAGVEADAASWLVLRASLQQSILVNSNKTEAGGVTTVDNSGLNDTQANLGAGFKFGKLWIDGALAAGTTGNLDAGAGNFMTTTSLNYTW